MLTKINKKLWCFCSKGSSGLDTKQFNYVWRDFVCFRLEKKGALLT